MYISPCSWSFGSEQQPFSLLIPLLWVPKHQHWGLLAYTKHWVVEVGQVFLMQYASKWPKFIFTPYAPLPKLMFAHLHRVLLLLQKATATKPGSKVDTVAESLVPWLLPHSHSSFAAPLYYLLGEEANCQQKPKLTCKSAIYGRLCLSCYRISHFVQNLVTRIAGGKNKEINLQDSYSISHAEPPRGLQHCSSGQTEESLGRLRHPCYPVFSLPITSICQAPALIKHLIFVLC